MNNTSFDVIIIGGSYSGLSAAMALGRSLRSVLIVDSGRPCNRQTPHAHNFIAHDGEAPAVIAAKAKAQVLQYPGVQFVQDKAAEVVKEANSFSVATEQGQTYKATKLLFATGMHDVMPAIDGFAACWGISVLHCPYCHGYEVRHQKMGVLGNGEHGYEHTKFIHNWSANLVLFTNGPSTIDAAHAEKLQRNGIQTIETSIQQIIHQDGYVKQLLLADGSQHALTALFARPEVQQHCGIPEKIGCELTKDGYIEINHFHETNIEGVFAAGDNTTMFRSVPAAVAAGNKAGAMINRELIMERFV